MKGKTIATVIGVVISIGLLWLFVRQVNLAEMAEAFKTFKLAYLLPAVVVYLSSFLVRAVRWQILLNPLKPISFETSFVVLMISWMANNLLPARMGELVRAFVIRKKEGVSVSGSFATVILERVLDGIILVAFLAVCLVVGGFSNEGNEDRAKLIGILAGGVFAAALAFLALLFFQEALALRIVAWFLRPLPPSLSNRLQDLLQSFVAGLACLRGGGAFAVVLCLSVIVWVCEAGTMWVLFKGFSMALPGKAAFFVLSILNLGILIPAGPGYAGTFETFGSYSLGLYGVDPVLAKTFTVLAHMVQFIPVTILGLLFLYREGLGLGALSRGSQEVGESK